VWCAGWVGDTKRGAKSAKKGVQKRGDPDRQVGAFSVFGAGHTGGPFIFRPKSLFFRKIGRFRGWCNTTPSSTWSEPASHMHCSLVRFVWLFQRIIQLTTGVLVGVWYSI